jgi:3-deoxy-D-manno-octulosonic-acid transferase
MTDPTGTMGIKTPAPQTDMAVVEEGGDTFLGRLQELNAARISSEMALANLRLGSDAQAAFNHANQRADTILADAKARAAKVETEAKTTVEAGAKRDAESMASIKQMLASAEQASERAAQIEQRLKEEEARSKEAREVIEQAKKDAVALRADLKRRVTVLLNAVKEASLG